MKLHQALLAAASTLLFTACGGLHDEPAPAPTPSAGVPASATASPTAYTQFAASLTNSETAEPLSLDAVTIPPTTETADPQPL
jgi:hypothetical protein